MSGRFEGQTLFVTGAGSGIGRATALRAGAEGGHVACADIDEKALGETAELVRGAGGTALAVACNVTDATSVREALAEAVAEFGGLQVLCNVAGICGLEHTEKVREADWNRIIGVNLTGTFFVSQAALPHLLANRRSVISNVASVAGLNGQAYSAAYCASKFGVVGLTKALAVEYSQRGLRVNCVCPGAVRTPMIGQSLPPEGADPDLLKRLALVNAFTRPEEVAGALLYLASEDARSINGIAMPMDFGNNAA
ncbi:MAG: SDR family oxidoreductase [Deltaproteobacteria bacterium]|nr:SDR family oxidoreductase [Deltaproteobacteria bacterium]MBW2362106.1 SDR family oxidoreductase [Deltaproteobacteria bacterium]